MTTTDRVVDILIQEGGYRELPKPFKVGALSFDFTHALVAEIRANDLVIVIELKSSTGDGNTQGDGAHTCARCSAVEAPGNCDSYLRPARLQYRLVDQQGLPRPACRGAGRTQCAERGARLAFGSAAAHSAASG